MRIHRLVSGCYEVFSIINLVSHLFHTSLALLMHFVILHVPHMTSSIWLWIVCCGCFKIQILVIRHDLLSPFIIAFYFSEQKISSFCSLTTTCFAFPYLRGIQELFLLMVMLCVYMYAYSIQKYKCMKNHNEEIRGFPRSQ